jgi:hypothetical protein
MPKVSVSLLTLAIHFWHMRWQRRLNGESNPTGHEVAKISNSSLIARLNPGDYANTEISPRVSLGDERERRF